VKIARETKTIWGFAVAFLAVLMAIRVLGFYTVTLDIIDGIVLLILAATILSETLLEGKFDIKDTTNAIGVFMAGVAIIFALLSFASVAMPEMLRGFEGFLYVALALVVVVELFK